MQKRPMLATTKTKNETKKLYAIRHNYCKYNNIQNRGFTFCSLGATGFPINS